MKISDFIRELELYIQVHGDDEVEFWVRSEDQDSEEASFIKVHDGYSEGGNGKLERTCDIIVKLD